MAQSPVVSVLITCHNLGQYLAEAVDSVLAQGIDEVEILIVDDGSTEAATMQVLDTFARPRTQIFRTPNRGLAAARNLLIERATGVYLCALDADDRLHPEYFTRALAAFEEDPSLCFVSSWLEAFGEEQWVWRQERCDLPALLAEDTVMTAALVRREAVLAVGGYDEGMPHQGDEDWDLWLRLVKAGYLGAILPEVLFYYRRRPGSMSTECVAGQTHLELLAYLIDKHGEAYQEHLHEVLLWKERESAELQCRNDSIARRLHGELLPALERRRAELAALRERAADSGEAALEEEYRRARHEIAALRSSWSWRLTAPLRRAWDLVRLVTGRRP